MTPQQRQKKNENLREWRRKKRREDPEWAAKQSAYSLAYAKSRKSDGTDFDHKRRLAKKRYYRKLTSTDFGKQIVRTESLESYRKTKNDPDRAKRYRESQNRYRSERKANDPDFALRCSLRARLSDLVSSGKTEKDVSALELVGCGLDELRIYIESQFLPGMDWSNYGECWHIDHIIPCSKFDLTDNHQRNQCFNYLNLRPCWAIENLRKGNRIVEPAQIPLGIR